ncbi:MAG: hypothetical protein KDK40_00740 [Chlamydiia bacterium]|nr:hypothetical protein [Chlamydiia bacterium]
MGSQRAKSTSRIRLMIALSGAIWLAVGFFLLSKGVGLVADLLQTPLGSTTLPALVPLTHWLGEPKNAIVALTALAGLIGSIKGRTILEKVANREVARLRLLVSPAFWQLYSPRQLLLIPLMISFGILLRYFNAPIDIRAFIQMTIGVALIRGSISYFRQISPLVTGA